MKNKEGNSKDRELAELIVKDPKVLSKLVDVRVSTLKIMGKLHQNRLHGDVIRALVTDLLQEYRVEIVLTPRVHPNTRSPSNQTPV